MAFTSTNRLLPLTPHPLQRPPGLLSRWHFTLASRLLKSTCPEVTPLTTCPYSYALGCFLLPWPPAQGQAPTGLLLSCPPGNSSLLQAQPAPLPLSCRLTSISSSALLCWMPTQTAPLSCSSAHWSRQDGTRLGFTARVLRADGIGQPRQRIKRLAQCRKLSDHKSQHKGHFLTDFLIPQKTELTRASLRIPVNWVFIVYI